MTILKMLLILPIALFIIIVYMKRNTMSLSELLEDNKEKEKDNLHKLKTSYSGMCLSKLRKKL